MARLPQGACWRKVYSEVSGGVESVSDHWTRNVQQLVPATSSSWCPRRPAVGARDVQQLVPATSSSWCPRRSSSWCPRRPAIRSAASRWRRCGYRQTLLLRPPQRLIVTGSTVPPAARVVRVEPGPESSSTAADREAQPSGDDSSNPPVELVDEDTKACARPRPQHGRAVGASCPGARRRKVPRGVREHVERGRSLVARQPRRFRTRESFHERCPIHRSPADSSLI